MFVVAAFGLSIACDRKAAPRASPPADASGLVAIALRVPAALSVARAIDTLSVAVDPEMLGLTQVTAHAGTVVGIEAHIRVFPRGETRAVLERSAVGPGVDFAVVATTWSVARDGIPMMDAKYLVEMQLDVFETDIPVSRAWEPHAGHYTSLWTRTLRQAEE